MAERNGICQKGIVAGRYPYLPERLLYPLKRVGKRGEGEFERISWDQALDEIGTKLRDIVNTYGSRSVIVNTFACGIPAAYSALSLALGLRLVYTSNCSTISLPPVDMSALFGEAIDFGNNTLCSFRNSDSLADAKYIIIWGGNPIGFTRAAHTTRTLMEAQERGVKIVDVGVIFDSTAAKADQFIGVRAGTDAALALAMANQMIKEGLHDEDALCRYTVAPFLVRDDNGLFLRASDIISGGDSTKYIFWDKGANAAMEIGASVYDLGACKPDLEAIVTVAGISCKTAFVRLKERLEPWTPETQEEITGVPADVAVQFLHEYMTHDPAVVFVNLGLRYMNGTHTFRAINLLPALSGNFTKKGGRFTVFPMADGHPVSFNELGMMWPNGFEKSMGRTVRFDEIVNCAKHPDQQQYKALIIPFSNPLHCWPNPKTVGEEFFGAMDLVVVFELRETDTNPWADYVLPECTPFEREEIIPSAECLVFQEPAIEPLGEAKPPAFIWGKFAKFMGVGELFEGKSTADWHRLQLQSGDPQVTVNGEPITYEMLKEQKIIRLNTSDEMDYYSENPLIFETPTGREEFYAEALAHIDCALAKYEPPNILGLKRLQYPLHFYPGRHRVFMQSQFQEFPELRAIGGHKASVSLNPRLAQEYGIIEGDLVEVFNERGSVKVRAQISEAFPPDMVHVWYAYPKKDYADHKSDPPTVLSTGLASPETENEFSLTWCDQWIKQNTERNPLHDQMLKNGMEFDSKTVWDDQCDIPSIGSFYGPRSSNETFWDDVCDIRKVEEA
jgi:molybdopterin-containing oxidoreductase family molybdopterin binding subunit